jgi:hypothetical protein
MLTALVPDHCLVGWVAHGSAEVPENLVLLVFTREGTPSADAPFQVMLCNAGQGSFQYHCAPPAAERSHRMRSHGGSMLAAHGGSRAPYCGVARTAWWHARALLRSRAKRVELPLMLARLARRLCAVSEYELPPCVMLRPCVFLERIDPSVVLNVRKHTEAPPPAAGHTRRRHCRRRTLHHARAYFHCAAHLPAWFRRARR